MEAVTKRIVAKFTIASLVAPIVVGALSYPVWLYSLRDSDPTGKAGFFVVVALIFLVICSVSVGSLLGLVFAIIAHRKKEAWVSVRIFSFILNASLVSFGCYTYLSLPRQNSMEQLP
jgi:hypothetical protein